MKRLILPLLVAALLCSCANKSGSEFMESEAAARVLPDAQKTLTGMPEQKDLYSDGRMKLIKTVNYRFEVENVKQSAEAIELAVKKYPAYISSSNLRLENPILENKITIRVQSEYFQELLKEIDQQARFVNFRDVSTNEVSKEFVDLESRLKTKRELEERYSQILRNKAGTIEELLQAEQQISELHEEIEATVSRVNYLKDQVSYSTINLEFYQTITQQVAAADQITWGGQFREALEAGWHGVMNVALLLTYIWPILLIAATAVVTALLWRKKKSLNFR